MYRLPAYKLGYQNSSPLEAFQTRLASVGASNKLTYLNANQFQPSVGAPSYSFGGPPNASPLQLGFRKGDQLQVYGSGPDNNKVFTFTDPSTNTVLETITPTVENYTFLVWRWVLDGVLTQTGREWMARLCAWSSIGDPDVPVTEDRLRWIGVGSGGFPMTPGVMTLDVPIEYETGFYLRELFAPAGSHRRLETVYDRTYTGSQLSISGPVLVSEVGLFADQSPSLNFDPAVGNNPPVFYKSFDGIMKSSDFYLGLQWAFTF